MVKTSTREKKIVLMKVEDIMNRPTNNNLATLLKTAWNSKVGELVFSKEIDIRELSLPNGDSVVMNVGITSEDTFLGEIVSFEPDGFLIVAQRDKTNDNSKLHLRQITTEEDDDPYKGITYFLAYEDYILFLDSGIRSYTVSKYISWMIEHAFKVTKGVYVKLNPEIQIEGDQAKLVEATTLEIRPVPSAPTTPIEGFIDDQKDRTETIRDAGTTNRILDALNLKYQSFQKYRENTDGDGVIEVQVKIKLKNNRRLIPVSQNLRLSTIMENTPDADFILIGKGGKTKGKLIRANYLADIDHSGSLMIRESVAAAFTAALKDFVERGCIK